MSVDLNGNALLQWVREKRLYHDKAAKARTRDEAFVLNHQSRALAFFEIEKEIIFRIRCANPPVETDLSETREAAKHA